jgi:hypothetical protein
MVAGSKERSATLTRQDGRKVETALNIANSDPDKSMAIQLTFDRQPGVSAHVTLTPQEGGAATLMAVKLHGNYAVLHDMLAGTKEARLAYAPDWLLNLTFRPVLRALGEDIEKERGFASLSGGESQADWEAKLSPGEQQQVAAWRRYEAARPATDPNADAQRYMSGGGN